MVDTEIFSIRLDALDSYFGPAVRSLGAEGRDRSLGIGFQSGRSISNTVSTDV